MSEDDGRIEAPTRATISQHLRQFHGYDLAYAIAAAPVVLIGEHERIHKTFDAGRLNHTHADE